MANKIKEIIVEPSKVYESSTFKLKIKAIRYMTCKEMKTKTCKCALDEYSEQLAKDIEQKFKDEAYDDTEIKQEISNIQEKIGDIDTILDTINGEVI